MLRDMLKNVDAMDIRMTSKEYMYMLLGFSEISADFNKILFDDARLNFSDESTIHLNAELLSNKRKYIKMGPLPGRQSAYDSGALYVSYQDPVKVCLSMRLKYMQNVILKEAELALKMSPNFAEKLLGLTFYIHEEGQLMTVLENPHLLVNSDNMKGIMNKSLSNNIYLHLSKMERLQRRPERTCRWPHRPTVGDRDLESGRGPAVDRW